MVKPYNPYKVELRTKTRSALSKAASYRSDGAKRDPKGRDIVFEDMYNSLVKSIECFVEFPEDKARRIIHELMLLPTTADSLKRSRNVEYEKTIKDVYKELAIEKLPEEIHVKLRGDYIYAYKGTHPNCWLCESTENYPCELVNAFQGDMTLLYVIREKVGIASAVGPRLVNSLITKCCSTSKNANYTALKAMFFSYYESRYIRAHSKVIGEYLKSMTQGKMDSMESVFQVLQRNYVRPDGTAYEVNVEKYAEEIQTFMAACSELQLDPRIALRNPECIYKLAESAKKLSF